MRQKSIHQEIWRDEHFAELSRQSKILALYCCTCPSVSLIPAFRLSDREILFDTGLNTSELQDSKQELSKFGIHFVDGYCVLKTPYAVFKYCGSKLEPAIEKQRSELPEKIIKLIDDDSVSIPYQYPIDTFNINNNINNNKNNNVDNLKRDLKNLLDYWNERMGTKYKSVVPLKRNFKLWSEEYTIEEMKRAIDNIPKHPFWKDKMKPETFLRTRNQNGDCDYIGELLSLARDSNGKGPHTDTQSVEETKRQLEARGYTVDI